MRSICERPALSTALTKRLREETDKIVNAADPEAEGTTRYESARRAKWFAPAIGSLACMAGTGQRCMGCSGSESAQLEHYRPKRTYPRLSLHWENMLWLCGICNQSKGVQFDEGRAPINPIVDHVWDHFFIDEFGNLCARWDVVANDLDARATETIRVYGLDRQALQESRFTRLLDLRERVTDSIARFESGEIDRDELELRALRWMEQPFQPDIADYFLAGPGRFEDREPFKGLVDLLDA
jgi:hypothetical protein